MKINQKSLKSISIKEESHPHLPLTDHKKLLSTHNQHQKRKNTSKMIDFFIIVLF